MRTAAWCILGLGVVQAISPAGAAQTESPTPHRLTFTRTIAPPIDLRPARQFAVTYAIGDTEQVGTFVDWLVEYAGKNGALTIENAVERNRYADLRNAGTLRRLQREHPADSYIGVAVFTCSGTEHRGEGPRRRLAWTDAVCEARLQVYDRGGKPVVSFAARGEGTSPRVESLTDEERQMALAQAARYTALDAADRITPRIIRDSIELDPSAPRFADGWVMVDAERLRDARAIWETSLRTHADSAALHYDLGALCEALDDYECARNHLASAVRLAPHERRYREELDEMPRRFGRK